MAHERDIIRNKVLSLDGHPISLDAYDFSFQATRAGLTWQCLEEIGQFIDKGDWDVKTTLKGYGVPGMLKLEALLAADLEGSTLLYLPRSDARLSPFAVGGDPAIFYEPNTEGVDRPNIKNKPTEFTATLNLASGQEPCLNGQVIYCNRSKVPAPIGAGVVTPDPVTLGELLERDDVAIPAVPATMARFTVHVSKMTGTGRITVKAEVLSDTSGFATPVVRYTFPLFVSDTPVGTNVVIVNGSKSQTVTLDGDVLSLPAETEWTIKLTVTDTDTDAAVEIIAAGAIYLK